jgi:hypothetical protein
MGEDLTTKIDRYEQALTAIEDEAMLVSIRTTNRLI